MKRYPKYKDSGVPWLGHVPANWEIKKVKHVFRYLKVINRGMICEDRLALTMLGVIPRSLDDAEGLQTEDYSNYQIVEENDLLFKLIDLQNIKTSRVGFVPSRGIVSPAYIRLKTRSTTYVKYYFWYFMSIYVRNIFNNMGAGVRQSLNQCDLLELPLLILTEDEMIKISAYLDLVTDEMDSAIEAQERMIELLKERRSAIITQAVTKGLNPNAKMKDSGVPWLGQVPAHWTLLRFKNLFVELDARKNLQLPVGSISYGKVVYKDDQDIHEPTKESYQAVLKDEFLINPINLNYDLKSLRTALSEINVCVSPAYIVLSAVGNVCLQYLRNLLYAFDLFHMKTLGEGVRHTITFNDIGSCVAVLPPVLEQEKIANFLRDQLTKMDSAIEAQERMIELLKERRSAIITQAVTGQIDVR